MDPLALRAAFRVAVLILVAALAILPFQRPGSAEAVVTVLAAIVGGLFVGAVWLAARWSSPPLPRRSTSPDDKPAGPALNATVARDGPRKGEP